FVLHQNYPNPFNPATTIEYRLGVPGSVTLDVIDLTGRRIETLVDRMQPPGQYSVQFDAAGLPSGTYLYQLRVGTQVASRRMVLLR
ncbi:MAG: T9SS type A sorting domain-containing protein, partial [Rhodothermaceae bacterium]|nr:T9SS type A sorting domain-containing protein [Rhodothermaceae bacterium]